MRTIYELNLLLTESLEIFYKVSQNIDSFEEVSNLLQS